VGADVARLLVGPADNTLEVFRRVALHVNARGRGVFLPLYARSGTGKTTLVSSLSTWLPKEFAATARLAGGEVSADRLRQAVDAAAQDNGLPANEDRIVIVNVDDRESARLRATKNSAKLRDSYAKRAVDREHSSCGQKLPATMPAPWLGLLRSEPGSRPLISRCKLLDQYLKSGRG